MAMFSDYDEAAPSAPLRRKKRRFDLSALAPLAETPMPQGQMVSGIYVRPNPIQSLTAGLSRGLGMAGAVQQGRDDRDMQRQAFEAKQAAQAEEQHLRRWQMEAAERRSQAASEQQSRTEELRRQELALRERELSYRTDAEAQRKAEFERRQTYRENYRPPAPKSVKPPRARVPNVDSLIEKYYKE